ncbi:MAG: preprotein translocase subunit SecG [Verrucomicrobia bacterium]|jgi:preprotein translocase subunit SecG|nr:preprotein translocase subunit SecG [Verrucomicrobiota bacterium]
MSFLIGLLTVVLVLDCVLLILLVLIQLPKKDAGAGVAFGGAATDALFGAGTGNVLTKVTKYATIVFFVLAVILGIMQSSFYHQPGKEFQRKVEQQAKEAPATMPTAPSAPLADPAAAPAVTSTNLMTTPAAPPPAPAPAPQK